MGHPYQRTRLRLPQITENVKRAGYMSADLFRRRETYGGNAEELNITYDERYRRLR